ncbi:MAG: hypothetical protein ACLT98_08840 [Eggerthellaceae bacterium]
MFRVQADRVTTRASSTVMLSFLDAADSPRLKHDMAEEDATMKFLKIHVQWKVGKLAVPESQLPCEGDELLIEIPSESMYLVSR